MTVGSVEARLIALGHELPESRRFPSENRTGVVLVGPMAFVSGHGPHHPGMDVKHRGKLGRDLTIEEGRAAALAAALSMLATLKAALGDLDRVRRVVRIFGMVNVTPEFEDMPLVIDGASDLFHALYGEHGPHARAAVGMASLPRGQPVEISGEFEIEERPS